VAVKKIIGLKELLQDLDEIGERLDDVEIITKGLAEGMRKFVHIDTGYLKTTIYHKSNIAGAKAPYAGFEADRYGDHDYPGQAIDAWNEGKYLDWVVEPF
jgi:hypothetical protein